MNQNQFWRPVAIASLFLFLCAAPDVTQAQSTAPTAAPALQAASGAAHPKKEPPNDFAGLDFTDEQKSEIEAIRKDMMGRKETVAKDES